MVGQEVERQLVQAALAREPEPMRALIRMLTPVIQARVARVLVRRPRQGRDVRQEVLDLTQEVFLALLSDNGRVLRAWDPSRGASLSNFVGLVAEREVMSILRSGRRSPFTEDATDAPVPSDWRDERSDVEARVTERDYVSTLLTRLEQELSPLGFQVFDMLWCQQLSPDETALALGMSLDAIYAWQSRIKKKARALADELELPKKEAR